MASSLIRPPSARGRRVWPAAAGSSLVHRSRSGGLDDLPRVGYDGVIMTTLLRHILSTVQSRSGSEPDRGDTETVRRIVDQLEAMPPDRARYVAAFAFVLARVANADQQISREETARMEAILAQQGGLPEDQAVLVVQIAKSRQRLAGGTENFLVTREFNEIAERDDKLRLLDCLFAVAAADDAVTLPEENAIRAIATELGLSHQEFSEVRSRYNDKRTILRGLPGGEP